MLTSYEEILKILKEENPYDASVFEYLSFHKDRFNFLLKKLSGFFKKGKNFLEAGSFSGFMMLGAKLIGYNVSGVDLNKYVERICALSEKYGFDNRAADFSLSKLPFSSDSFDVILFSETLEHLNFHPLEIFREFSRLLKLGGVIIITTPNLNRLNNCFKIILGQSINAEIDQEYTDGTHYREYNLEEISYLAHRVGLEIETVDYLNFKYPDLGFRVKVTDFLSKLLFINKRRDVCVVAVKK